MMVGAAASAWLGGLHDVLLGLFLTLYIAV
jgi:hypothetical protein